MEPVVPRMNPVQARAWVALVSIAELLPQTLDAQLTADAGIINFEYGILSVLNVAQDRTMRMGEVGAALRAPAPKLSKAVKRLEGRGLVERRACPDDKRAVDVTLTNEGRRTWLAATPPHVALARDTILGGLSSTRLEQLAALLEKVAENIDP